MEKVGISKSDILGVLIERPIGFSFNGKHFDIYPPSLGKLQLMSILFEKIGALSLGGTDNIYDFCYQRAESMKEDSLRLICYATLQGDDCLSESKVKQRMTSLKKMERKDIATLLVTILTLDKTDAIIRHFNIDEEMKKLERISKVKAKGNSSYVSIGGKSLWGTLIDVACERYGWSFQYVLWGISYSNLRLMLSDQNRSILLTKDERKYARIPSDDIVIRADDTKTLNDFIRTQNWK